MSRAATSIITVTSVGLVKASDDLERTGLVGWVTIAVNDGLMVDGIALRRLRSGGLALSYPVRKDGSGKSHPIVRPLNEEVRRAVEGQIFKQLGLTQTVRP